MLVHTTKTYGSHGPDKRSHQKQAALTKLKGTFLLQCLAAFCVLDNVGATTVATSVTPPSSPPPPCATPVDFALVLDESYSMNRQNGPDFMNGPKGVKAFAKELVRHAAMKPRSPPMTAHEPEPASPSPSLSLSLGL